MKIILSRKGFDSTSGGGASPILPDGRMLSLPIPSNSDLRRYDEIFLAGIDVGKLVSDLTPLNARYNSTHIDPDLSVSTLPRKPGWRPALGQIASAQGHLRKHGVGLGDLFLFFGWFRNVESLNGTWRYKPGSPDLHVLFGWLQIGEVVSISGTQSIAAIVQRNPWLHDHPHIAVPKRFEKDGNTVYIATDHFCIGEQRIEQSGGGIFEKIDTKRILTAPGNSRSRWQLPSWFSPEGRQSALSFHGKSKRWTPEGSTVRLNTVGRGQEFVLDCDHYPESIDWLMQLF
ncbi:hypothetical protein [Propionivibrio sp.]|uniref:Nmad3 family putative nucleotide modification protein n=1 Tax=Propionivibrio sp. TaxID=2212460 RepID=UPI003BEF5408